MNFIERMTHDMRNVLLDIEVLKEEFRFCMKHFLEADKQSNVKLPLDNEEGLAVVHGSRLIVDIAKTYWEYRVKGILHYLSSMMPREEYWKFQDEFKGFNFSLMRWQKNVG